mmetsp:Transcript_29390/g.70029  ORF Transcript_29390/g.70029 Transcript_29390/m.70029 type:complete len:266 (+) Transcript_29390:1964-2761(+)
MTRSSSARKQTPTWCRTADSTTSDARSPSASSGRTPPSRLKSALMVLSAPAMAGPPQLSPRGPGSSVSASQAASLRPAAALARTAALAAMAVRTTEKYLLQASFRTSINLRLPSGKSSSNDDTICTTSPRNRLLSSATNCPRAGGPPPSCRQPQGSSIATSSDSGNRSGGCIPAVLHMPATTACACLRMASSRMRLQSRKSSWRDSIGCPMVLSSLMHSATSSFRLRSRFFRAATTSCDSSVVSAATDLKAPCWPKRSSTGRAEA